MRMNPDGTVEGTPEELAAFKHIDAALAAKDGKPKQQRKKPAKKEKETVEISETLNQTLNYLEKNGSIMNANAVAAGLNIKPATAQWRLNKLASLGLVTKPQRGLFER